MASRRILSIALAATFIAAAAASASASPSAQLRCTELLTALRDGKFDRATEHFDATMSAALPPSKLGQVWKSVTSGRGRVTGWKLATQAQLGGEESFIYHVSFEHGEPLQVNIAIISEMDEVSGLYFRPIAAAKAAPASPPPYANPHSYFSQDAIVGKLKLPGRLTIPSTGIPPYPAAVLIGGSGPGDMNETIGPNHIFKDIADGLSSRGIVVLRYDKRTHHPALIKDLHTFTVRQEYIDDAVAAIDQLRNRTDVNPKRIFLIGHSEGAMILPDIARKAGGVAGLVMLAPPGRPLLDMAIAQMKYLGSPPENITAVENLRGEIASGKLPPGKILTLEPTARAPVIYFTDLNKRDEFAVARNLHEPILILHGGRDYQVTDVDIAAWRSHLSGVPNVRFREFPSLNHLFLAGTGKPGPADYATPGHVAALAIEAIASFVDHPAGAADAN